MSERKLRAAERQKVLQEQQNQELESRRRELEREERVREASQRQRDTQMPVTMMQRQEQARLERVKRLREQEEKNRSQRTKQDREEEESSRLQQAKQVREQEEMRQVERMRQQRQVERSRLEKAKILRDKEETSRLQQAASAKQAAEQQEMQQQFQRSQEQLRRSIAPALLPSASVQERHKDIVSAAIEAVGVQAASSSQKRPHSEIECNSAVPQSTTRRANKPGNAFSKMMSAPRKITDPPVDFGFWDAHLQQKLDEQILSGHVRSEVDWASIVTETIKLPSRKKYSRTFDAELILRRKSTPCMS